MTPSQLIWFFAIASVTLISAASLAGVLIPLFVLLTLFVLP